MRLKEAAGTSAFVLKFRAEKLGDPSPWAVSPLKPPSLSENASQSVLFPASFIGEVGRDDSALLFRSSFPHSLPCSQPAGGSSTQNQDTRVPMEWVCFSGPTYCLTEKHGC